MSDPTFADVANKTVDHIFDGVKGVSAAVQKVAPHAWEIAVRQQRLEAVIGGIGAALLAVAALTAARFIINKIPAFREGICRSERRRYPSLCAGKEDSELNVTVEVFPFYALAGFCVGCAAIALYCCGCSVLQLANPEYYAAKALLEAVK